MNFLQLYHSLPDIIKTKLYDLKSYKENPLYHPEANCFIHIGTVTERCLLTRNVNLICTGILHDICKKDVSRINPKTGFNMSPGHEQKAVEFILNNKEVQDWIKNTMNADLDLVIYLVKNHMRIKQMSQMRKAKQDLMKSDPNFKLLQIFNGFDNMLATDDNINYWVNKGLEL